MPVIAALAFAAGVILLAIVLLPLSLVQRYRAGTSRQQARGWLITVNLAGIALSCVMLLASAAVTNIWVPRAFGYTAAGLAAGVLLGLLGLAVTRWEATVRSLHYTPNRLLVLAITLTVAARLIYGFWRSWQTWATVGDRTQWLVTWGVAEALAAGAVVLGYYLAYWAGVRRRYHQHERRPLRPYAPSSRFRKS